MAFQPSTLQGVGGNGYSILFNPAASLVEFSCRSGEYWVRPSPQAAASTVPASGALAGYTAATGVNTNVTNPITAPLTKGWVRLLAGDDKPFGDSISEAGIGQVDVWCVTSGDLIVDAH